MLLTQKRKFDTNSAYIRPINYKKDPCDGR